MDISDIIRALLNYEKKLPKSIFINEVFIFSNFSY